MANFGVIGPGKMGQLFIRNFLNIGAKLVYLKASNKNRTKKKIFAYKKEKKFFQKSIDHCDFLVVSSSIKTHYKYINALFKKKNLLIEKPFFFCTNRSYNWHLKKAKKFLKSKRNIDINLSNYILGDAYKKHKFYKKKYFKNFFFSFHTDGNCHYKFIILDLMPHFFSIMQRLTPCKSIKIIEKKIKKYNSFLILKVDNYICHIDLKENQKIKKMSFGFDDLIVTRKQIFNKNNLINYLYDEKHKFKINFSNPLIIFTDSYYDGLKKKNNNLKKKFIYKNFRLTLKTYFF
jgi:hypothetical protein